MSNIKQQIVAIHGGDVYETHDEYMNFIRTWELSLDSLRDKKDWKDNLQKDMGDEYDVLRPTMPCKWNAKYIEWKLWFDKIVPLLTDDVILIGHSLGGTFLAKYLAENKMSIRIKSLLLVAACSGDFEGEKLCDFNFKHDEDFSLLNEQVNSINLFHSEDDFVVPYIQLDVFEKALPNAVVYRHEEYGHYLDERYNDIIESIKGLE